MQCVCVICKFSAKSEWVLRKGRKFVLSGVWACHHTRHECMWRGLLRYQGWIMVTKTPAQGRPGARRANTPWYTGYTTTRWWRRSADTQTRVIPWHLMCRWFASPVYFEGRDIFPIITLMPLYWLATHHITIIRCGHQDQYKERMSDLSNDVRPSPIAWCNDSVWSRKNEQFVHPLYWPK